MSVTRSSTTSRRTATAALAAGLALTLSACGSNDDAAGSSPGSSASSSESAPATAIAPDHNDTDVTFINDMTPHHSSAIQMAEMAATRAASPQVKELAVRIAAAQGPEQDEMKAMAAAWGVPAPSTATSMTGGHHMSGMSGSAMPDMDMDMSMLEPLSGTAFDKQFLTMMTEHHESALPMAQAEIGGGSNPQAKQLAQDVLTAQTAEISRMQELLTTL